MIETMLEDATRLHQGGRLQEAARLYSDVLRIDPRRVDALAQLGLIHLQGGRAQDALVLFTAAIRVNPQVPQVHYNRGCALQALERDEEALACFAHALALNPDYIEARNNRGVTLLRLRRLPEALACFDRVVAGRPEAPIGYNNRATALLDLKDYPAALAAAQAAVERDSGVPESFYHRGAALCGLNRPAEAMPDFDRALSLRPHYGMALAYRGIALTMLRHYEDAVASFGAGLRVTPGDIDLLYNRAGALQNLKRYEDAIRDWDAVLAARPQYKYARGNRLFCLLQCCDWRTLEAERTAIAEGLRDGLPLAQPLQPIGIFETGAEELQCARIWVAQDYPPAPQPLAPAAPYGHERIRVAYVSGDFRAHAVASLAAGLFEQHDKTIFDTIAVSLGPNDGSTMRKRLENAFGEFIDASAMSDGEVAALLRAREVDIAVDLMGFTEGSRPGIFAHRPAPVQVNYLGFPGSMGAPYMDYVLADAVVLAPEQETQFSERVVRLPHCYMPMDSTRAVGPPTTRAEAGLPEQGFVFCGFNNLSKLMPDIFGIWLRLLQGVEGSVLWLSQAGPAAMRNLREAAEAHGVKSERLIFATHAPTPETHLARLALADLFLDTAPYNAHAGAADALWAGVPAATIRGRSFAGRVGASLLTALGLPELIAESRGAYETLTLNLARDADALAATREKLARARAESPLFDTRRSARALEAAYIAMRRAHEAGEPAAGFTVPEMADINPA